MRAPYLSPLALLLTLFVTLLAPAFAAAPQPPADPRPIVLILGDRNSRPFSAGAPWPDQIQKNQPEWNVVTVAPDRLLPQWPAEIAGLMKPYTSVAVVLIFTGTDDVAAANYAKTDATALAQHMTDLIAQIRATPAGAKSLILLATPMPVLDARLDQWSKEKYLNGEAHSDALAAAYRTVAKTTAVTLVDFHAWAKAEKDDAGKPGPLLGSLGWAIRDWGHPIVARYFEPILKTVNPQPEDPAAMVTWRAWVKAEDTLDQLLAATCASTVTVGPAFAPAPILAGATAPLHHAIFIPAEALQGPTLAVAFSAPEGKIGLVGARRNLPNYRTPLTVETDTGKVTIELDADWQMLDEAQPNSPVDPDLYRANVGKMNYFGIANGTPGQRSLVVARYPLTALAGKKITGGTITLPGSADVARFTAPDKLTPVPGSQAPVIVAPILGADATFDNSYATWKTRDGKKGWLGGLVDAPARRTALENFLKTNPPAYTTARATAELKN
jgi:hypothetical protein